MNVFAVEMKEDGDRVAFALEGSEGQSLTYKAADFSAELRRRLKQEPSLMLGVRPHAVHIGGQGLKARVVTCQWLGDQTHIAAEIAGRTVVSVSHEQIAARPGSEVFLGIAPQELHIFSAGDGAAIAHGASLV
jgi:multiple sugar transport system ATP-binding protein